MQEAVDRVTHSLALKGGVEFFCPFKGRVQIDMDFPFQRFVGRIVEWETHHIGRIIVPEKLPIQPVDRRLVRQNHIYGPDGKTFRVGCVLKFFLKHIHGNLQRGMIEDNLQSRILIRIYKPDHERSPKSISDIERATALIMTSAGSFVKSLARSWSLTFA